MVLLTATVTGEEAKLGPKVKRSGTTAPSPPVFLGPGSEAVPSALEAWERLAGPQQALGQVCVISVEGEILLKSHWTFTVT